MTPTTGRCRVDNAAAIARTPGVDFVLIGTGDLSLSLGSGDREKACRGVLQACRDAGIVCAIYTGSAEQAAARAGEGYAMVIAANDISVVAQGFTEAMRRFRGAVKTPAAKT